MSSQNNGTGQRPSLQVRFFLGSAGCQPAVAGSLPATRFARSREVGVLLRKASRQAAEMGRLAACAPQMRNPTAIWKR